MKNSSLCLLSALGGAVLGAAIAMLVTPHSGKELRGKIRAAVNEAAEKIRTAQCGCEGEDCHCNG
ncbi:MAG: YtxH domain-containing protein [Alistipes sp.]|nr:YtxH domain-containing protein [Alistipes sp.]